MFAMKISCLVAIVIRSFLENSTELVHAEISAYTVLFEML